MRLIDADVENERLLDFIAENDREIAYAIEHQDMKMLKDIFSDYFEGQKTAYDLDKVVKQMKKNMEIAITGYSICNADTHPVIYTKNRIRYKERLNCLKIVKSGYCQGKGVTDNE